MLEGEKITGHKGATDRTARLRKGWVGVKAYLYVDRESVHNTFYVDDKSVHSDQFYVSWKILDRHYDFFADLAGVRGAGPDPKGIPDDASDMTKLFVGSWGGDGHSHTYYSAEEFGLLYLKQNNEDYVKMMKDRMLGLDDPIKMKIASLLGAPWSGVELDKYRIVLWFDN